MLILLSFLGEQDPNFSMLRKKLAIWKNWRRYESLNVTDVGLDWLGFMAYQLLYVILCQIHFSTYKQFYFKQFSLT